jgi:2-(1,2-epoxy-1,2-dihydrophenyl)acetyl-CoA isomerase
LAGTTQPSSQVVPDDELTAHARRLGVALAQGPTRAFAAVRRAVVANSSVGLAEALETEPSLMAEVGGSKDHTDAVAAFLARTTPTYTGH